MIRILLVHARRLRVAREPVLDLGHLVTDVLDRGIYVSFQHECDVGVHAARVGVGSQLIDSVDGVDDLLDRLGESAFNFLDAGAW